MVGVGGGQACELPVLMPALHHNVRSSCCGYVHHCVARCGGVWFVHGAMRCRSPGTCGRTSSSSVRRTRRHTKSPEAAPPTWAAGEVTLALAGMAHATRPWLCPFRCARCVCVRCVCVCVDVVCGLCELVKGKRPEGHASAKGETGPTIRVQTGRSLSRRPHRQRGRQVTEAGLVVSSLAWRTSRGPSACTVCAWVPRPAPRPRPRSTLLPPPTTHTHPDPQGDQARPSGGPQPRQGDGHALHGLGVAASSSSFTCIRMQWQSGHLHRAPCVAATDRHPLGL